MRRWYPINDLGLPNTDRMIETTRRYYLASAVVVTLVFLVEAACALEARGHLAPGLKRDSFQTVIVFGHRDAAHEVVDLLEKVDRHPTGNKLLERNRGVLV